MSRHGSRPRIAFRSALSAFVGAIGLGACALIMLSALAPTPANAVIPDTERTLEAMATVNRASGRTKALQLDVSMRVGGDAIVATGQLVSHPSGLARLELRGEGRVDRYLLSGLELEGSTNGQPQSQPRGYLQPFFLMQPASASTLRSALGTFGIEVDSLGLAPCGDKDCFVLGDPRLAAPVQIDPNPVSAAPPELSAALGGYVDESQLPRFWVGMEDLQVRRVDRGNGNFVVYGPMKSFGKIKVPEWFEIHEADQVSPVRFEVDRAVQVNAPPKAFNRGWLSSAEVLGGGGASAPLN